MRIKGMGERELGMLLAAVLIGRLQVVGINPFCSGFFMAICFERLPNIYYWIALCVGLVSVYSPMEVGKYALILAMCGGVSRFMEKKIKRPALWMYSLAGSVCVFAVEAFIYEMLPFGNSSWTSVLIQSILSGVFTQVLYIGMHHLLTGKKTAYAGNEELISIMVLGSMAIFGMPFQDYRGFSILKMFLALFILLAGYRYGAGAGSLAGITGGMFFLARPEGELALGILGVLGVSAGLFRELGKIVSGVTFFSMYLLCGKLYDRTYLEPDTLRSVVVAVLVFLCLPKRFSRQCDSVVLEKEMALQNMEQLEKQVKRKLEHFAEPFLALSRTFFRLAEQKVVLEEQDMDSILLEVNGRLCRDCEKANRCLGFSRHDKYHTASCILPAAREHGYLELGDFPMNFVNKCDYLSSYLDVTNQELRMLHNDMRWQNKLAESRQAIGEQFQDIGMLLKDFANEISREKTLELNRKRELAAVLKRNQVLVRKIEKLENNNRYQEIHLLAKSRKRVCVTTRELARYVSAVLEKRFVPIPESKNVLSKEYQEIVLVEDTKFKAITGMARRCKDGELVCGDSYSFVKLDTGELVMTLADGMGTGQLAATESTAVVDLLEHFLEAGVSERTAIRLINSVFVLKSGEQGLSTLDMAIVNLYTGVCEFIKMGAATAFIKRGGQVEQIVGNYLPMGVFLEAQYDNVSKKLYGGDFIILMSDGILERFITQNREQMVVNFLEELTTQNPNEMAHAILEYATGERGGEHGDDMTVLVAALWEKEDFK